jgi:hypothetical protein
MFKIKYNLKKLMVIIQITKLIRIKIKNNLIKNLKIFSEIYHLPVIMMIKIIKMIMIKI